MLFQSLGVFLPHLYSHTAVFLNCGSGVLLSSTGWKVIFVRVSCIYSSRTTKQGHSLDKNLWLKSLVEVLCVLLENAWQSFSLSLSWTSPMSTVIRIWWPATIWPLPGYLHSLSASWLFFSSLYMCRHKAWRSPVRNMRNSLLLYIWKLIIKKKYIMLEM